MLKRHGWLLLIGICLLVDFYLYLCYDQTATYHEDMTVHPVPAGRSSEPPSHGDPPPSPPSAPQHHSRSTRVQMSHVPGVNGMSHTVEATPAHAPPLASEAASAALPPANAAAVAATVTVRSMSSRPPNGLPNLAGLHAAAVQLRTSCELVVATAIFEGSYLCPRRVSTR